MLTGAMAAASKCRNQVAVSRLNSGVIPKQPKAVAVIGTLKNIHTNHMSKP
jgi:hypothetical protein